MMWFLSAILLLLLSLGSAMAQVPMTGAGLGTPAAAPPSFTGTGDVVSGFNAWWSPGIAYSAAYAAGLGNAADVCDSGGTNCITLKVQASGLVAAPGATACGGNACVAISKLYDQSGASYCSGPCDLVQATNAKRPPLLTNCGTGTMLCAQFTTVGGFFLNGPALPSIAQPFTITGVIEPTFALPSNDTEILSTPCNSLYGIGNNGTAPTFEISSGTDFANNTTLLSINTMYALTGVYSGTVNSISSVNGTQITGNAGTAAYTGGITTLGFSGCFTGSQYGGYVMEVGIKGTPAFTGTQITNVTTRQRANWGF
jgi:hypothetical protein